MSSAGNLISFVNYVREHGDELLLMLQKLPAGLRAAGSGMVAAGDGAVLAGRALGGASAERANAAEVLESMARGVEECHLQITAIARELRAAADALDQVKVPSIPPVKNLVGGLKLGDQGAGLFGDVVSSLRAQADAMETRFGGQLRTVSENLGGMSKTLDSAGDRLQSLGSSLKEGGTALEQFSS